MICWDTFVSLISKNSNVSYVFIPIPSAGNLDAVSYPDALRVNREAGRRRDFRLLAWPAASAYVADDDWCSLDQPDDLKNSKWSWRSRHCTK